MSGRRTKALRREFRESYGFGASKGEMRQLKRGYVRKQTLNVRLDRRTQGSFFPVDRRDHG